MIYILYHANCADGFAAACIALRAAQAKSSQHDIILESVSYESLEQSPLSLGPKSTVLYVDYTPPDHIIQRVRAAGAKLFVIDHHASAAHLHRDMLADHGMSLFQLDHSGAALTAQHFFSESSPSGPHHRPIQLLEHYDLGRCWDMPDHHESLPARYLVAYLMRAIPREAKLWNQVLFDWPSHERQVCDIGGRLHAADMQLVRAVTKRPHWVNIGGFEVPAVNGIPYGCLNDALHELLQQHPDAAFAASWTVVASADRETVIKWSLRGGGPNRKICDLGSFCRTLDTNGGGHPKAAGFATTDPVMFI